MMNKPGSGKTVLITGASRGIGAAIARAAAEEGYAVTIHYHRQEERGRLLRDEIHGRGGKAELISFDIADRAACAEKLGAYVEERGTPWGIICNAGICADRIFPGMEPEDWDSVIRTNLDGFYNVLHPLIMPLCRKKKGRIITLSSVSGIAGNRGQVNYSAAKAGIIGASKALALELAGRSITVNCIAPGIIDTDMTENLDRDTMLPSIPMGRTGSPEEVAALAVFLLSEGAAYITRQVIAVDGGLI